MKISLITINKNNADGLRRTIESIRAQAFYLPPGVELEHVVVDGESTDASRDILATSRPDKVIALPSKGVYHAINAGIEASSGDIIGLLHSGDIYTVPDAINLIARRFAAKDSPDYIWGDVRIGRRYYSGKDFGLEYLLTGFAPPHPSLHVSRKVVRRIGLYSENYHTAADFDYFVRLCLDPSLSGSYLPGALINMEPGGLSSSLKNRLWINNRDRLRSLRAHNLQASYWRLLFHYKQVIDGYLWWKRQH